jgi:hypothetical protein
MLHPDDLNSGPSRSPSVSGDSLPFAFGGPSFGVETPPFATAYAGVPSQTVRAHSSFSPGSVNDWTVAPAVLLIFIVLTAVAIPLFIYRLALRFGRIQHPGLCGRANSIAGLVRTGRSLRPTPTKGSRPGSCLYSKSAR